jgi:hypothetical protein
LPSSYHVRRTLRETLAAVAEFRPVKPHIREATRSTRRRAVIRELNVDVRSRTGGLDPGLKAYQGGMHLQDSLLELGQRLNDRAVAHVRILLSELARHVRILALRAHAHNW